MKHQYFSCYFSIKKKVNQQRIPQEGHHPFHSFSPFILHKRSSVLVLFECLKLTVPRLFINLSCVAIEPFEGERALTFDHQIDMAM